MTSPTFSPYGGFHEGDHVTRDGSDVHLVKDMNADGFAATFVCVVAPGTGWTAVGDEEFNVCRRYERVTLNETTGHWELAPGRRTFHIADPFQTITDKMNALRDSFITYVDALVKAGLLKHIRRSAHRGTRAHQRRFARNPKRRALRK